MQLPSQMSILPYAGKVRTVCLRHYRKFAGSFKTDRFLFIKLRDFNYASMDLSTSIGQFNEKRLGKHSKNVAYLKDRLDLGDDGFSTLVKKISTLQVAIPSWALGTGGTRFGRFAQGGEPRNLEEKIEDVGVIQSLSRATNSISLHIPWDIPDRVDDLMALLKQHNLKIDAVNSNTFQDQPGQKHSYRFGSLCHTNPAIRQQAVEHNLEVIGHGKAMGSKTLSVWLADGSNFPGQIDFRKSYQYTLDALKEIYRKMPSDWTMLIEYKPYEPNFYSMVLPDWGTSLKMSEACGDRAHVLVDLGHHLPNTNIEQIVARLLHFGRLGGFHFNGSQYGDDDLTTGSIKPYQLFLIFAELVAGAQDKGVKNPEVAYMIDASHNIKDPIEDLLMSLENIRVAYAKALLIDFNALAKAQQSCDVVESEQILQRAFQTDVRPIIAEARVSKGGSIDPVAFFREAAIRKSLVSSRGKHAVATGL
jgi:L-rhamnose isomerase/sugar isomerase